MAASLLTTPVSPTTVDEDSASPLEREAEDASSQSAQQEQAIDAAIPPYWRRHERTVSNISTASNGLDSRHRNNPIILIDNTEPDTDGSRALWAKSVSIDDYFIISGSGVGAGSYVVWNCSVETLDGGIMRIRKRYSEFDALRQQLAQTFPHAEAALPLLPRKSMISKFRPKFLEARREGLTYFLNCILLNPEFASSPVLKDFLFA